MYKKTAGHDTAIYICPTLIPSNRRDFSNKKEIMDQVLIFKTDVDCMDDVNRLAALLESTGKVRQWSFDLTDCDRVLRLVSTDLHPRTIEKLLRAEGICCENMAYEL